MQSQPRGPEPWAIVLAAGDGTRLRSLTTDPEGRSTPKQFCTINGEGSLLQQAFRRAGRVVPRHRITTIVAAHHEPWWRGETATLPEGNVVVQPSNRGTAVGVLTPLLCIHAEDPAARVVLLPSDHFVADERIMGRVLREGLEQLERDPDRVVLLGIIPDEPDTGFGWIVPGAGPADEPRPVRRFVEKPAAQVALELMRCGGLWNSFVLAAEVRVLLELFDRAMPEDVTRLWSALSRDPALTRRPNDLAPLYERLASRDFCRDVLEGAEERLSVLAVPPCGWSDLGTPERVIRCLADLGGREPRPDAHLPERPDLARMAAAI